MNILITGGNGYIGKSLYLALKDKYNVTRITRRDFDLTSHKDLNKFFRDKYFDVVIHCAVQGGSRLKKDSYKDMDSNLKMYYNLLEYKFCYKKLIHFGSGAEIYNLESPYGLSKKVISNSMLEVDNFYNIRLFGVFDFNEIATRFIKANLQRYINNESMVIHEDMTMDFFYMEDLINLVQYYINVDKLEDKVIDCRYVNSPSLYSIASYINTLDTHKVDIKVGNVGIKEYVGIYKTMPIGLIGLEDGITRTYNRLKQINQ